MKIKLLKSKTPILILTGLVILTVIFSIGWWVGHPAEKQSVSSAQHGEEAATKWTCSMHPQIMLPDPGACPICLMDLIPATANSGGNDSSIIISKKRANAMGIRIAPIQRQLATRSISLVGQVVEDERYTNTITSRMAGRIERLFVDYTGISVKKGDHLAEIYAPDLLVAQKELIEAKRFLHSSGTASVSIKKNRQRLYQAAKEKLRLLELTAEQIKTIESSNSPSDRLTIYAPEAGTITKKFISKGDYVKTGTPLYTVSDLSSIWLTMEAYEQDLPWLHYAQEVTFTTPAVPGKTFSGTIAFIDPVLSTSSRTSRVRVNVKNEDKLLKPGMFARAVVAAQVNDLGQVIISGLEGKWISPMHPEIIKDHPGVCDICGMKLVQASDLGVVSSTKSITLPLVVPYSAVLQTGKNAVVYKRNIKDGELEFEAVEVTLGHRVDQFYIVKDGLSEGDFVATQGAFKIDSELQINAKKSMMSMAASYVGPPVPNIPLNKEELAKLNKTLAIYLTLSHQMAHDKPAAAIASTSELATALADCSQPPLSALAEAVKSTKSVDDIKSWLDPLTIQLVAIIKQRAAGQLTPLYLLHCPMALANAGGHWLGTTPAIENPYFGSQMFACGSVKAQLTVKAHHQSHKNHNH